MPYALAQCPPLTKPCLILLTHWIIHDNIILIPSYKDMIEYTEIRNFAQGEEECASHRDSATMDVA